MSKHVIFSRAANNAALSNESIAALAPAVFATTKHDRLTERYVPLHTSALIPVMRDYGYEPVQAAQKRSRDASNAEHASHMLAFAKPHYDDGIDGVRPEIILYNSHDGTNSVKLYAGAFRFICSNGIVAGEGFQSRLYHNKSAMIGFEDMLRNTVATLPTLMERIQRLRSVQFSSAYALEMAKRGIATRWESHTGQTKAGVYSTGRTLDDALRITRYADDKMDAFTVFNRIQESVVRGNVFIKSITDKQPDGTMRKARPINSVKEGLRVNTELWDIADEMVCHA